MTLRLSDLRSKCDHGHVKRGLQDSGLNNHWIEKVWYTFKDYENEDAFPLPFSIFNRHLLIESVKLRVGFRQENFYNNVQ